MKRSWTILLLVLLLGLWIGVERWMYWRVTPPAHVVNISSFLQWRPDARQWIALNINNQSYLMATGPGGGLLPSGPSAYVFEEDGHLVDWSADMGDDSKFDNKWRAQEAIVSGRHLARQEAQR